MECLFGCIVGCAVFCPTMHVIGCIEILYYTVRVVVAIFFFFEFCGWMVTTSILFSFSIIIVWLHLTLLGSES